MANDNRVNLRLDDDTNTRLDAAAAAIGSTAAGVAHMLVRWYLGDASQPPARPAHMGNLTPQESHT